MKQIRKRLTYANVMSSIAVFLVVGGATAFAAGHLGKNTVGAKQLKKNAVATAKIKKEAVTGAKIKKGTITGANLNLAQLGTVPSATNASSATNATNATKLNGLGPETYLDRVAQQASDEASASVSALTATDVTSGGPASLTVPSGVNFVEVEGQASLAGVSGADYWTLWVQQDSTCSTGSSPGYKNRVFGRLQEAGDQETMSQQFVFSVTPGVHTYRLCVDSDLAATAFSRVLIAHTIAGGSTGGTTGVASSAIKGSSVSAGSNSINTP